MLGFMDIREVAIMLTEDAMNLMIQTAHSMPEENFRWQPLESGRTAWDQVAECVQVADWMSRIIAEKSASFLTPEFVAQQKLVRPDLGSMDELEKHLRERYGRFFEVIRSQTDDDLNRDVLLRGCDVKVHRILFFPMRNMYYHFGQINYIQTLYGDLSMH